MDAATISRQLDTIISLLKLTNQDALVGVRRSLTTWPRLYLMPRWSR